MNINQYNSLFKNLCYLSNLCYYNLSLFISSRSLYSFLLIIYISTGLTIFSFLVLIFYTVILVLFTLIISYTYTDHFAYPFSNNFLLVLILQY